MPNTSNKGLKRIYNAFFYSMAGFSAAWKNETALRQEALIAIVLIPIAFWLGQDATQIGLLILSVLVVLITELLNSGMEAAIDRIGSERHELSKYAKDISSAAVFISLTVLTVAWGLVIFEQFLT